MKIQSVILCLVVLASCSPGTEVDPIGTAVFTRPESPSILLITLDTTRRDHLGCYGQEGGITPNLDALASRSVSSI